MPNIYLFHFRSSFLDAFIFPLLQKNERINHRFLLRKITYSKKIADDGEKLNNEFLLTFWYFYIIFCLYWGLIGSEIFPLLTAILSRSRLGRRRESLAQKFRFKCSAIGDIIATTTPPPSLARFDFVFRLIRNQRKSKIIVYY